MRFSHRQAAPKGTKEGEEAQEGKEGGRVGGVSDVCELAEAFIFIFILIFILVFYLIVELPNWQWNCLWMKTRSEWLNANELAAH